MENQTQLPRMMTVREIAKTGILPEHAIRYLVRKGEIPYLQIASKRLINFDWLVWKLNNLDIKEVGDE